MLQPRVRFEWLLQRAGPGSGHLQPSLDALGGPPPGGLRQLPVKAPQPGALGSVAFCCRDGGCVVRPRFRRSGRWQLASKVHWVVLDKGREGRELALLPKGNSKVGSQSLSPKHHKGLEFG